MNSYLRNPDYKAVVGILAVALLLRLSWAALIPVVPLSDSKAYDLLALTLVEHGVYGFIPTEPSAYWPVGTSAIYAALYTVLGHGYASIVVLNIALSIAVVGLTMVLALHFFDRTTAVLAGSLLAIWPTQIAYVTVLASELPFTVLVLLAAIAWFGLRSSPLTRGAASGLALGAAAYFRPIALLLPVVFWLSAVPNWRELGRQIPTALIALMVIGLVIAPWSVRNTKHFGHPVLLSTNGGAVLWMGNNPDTNGSYMPLPDFVRGLDEYEREKALSRVAWSYIEAEPVAFVLRTIRKAVRLHLGETIAVHWNAVGIAHRFGEGAITPLKVLTQGFWTGVLLLALAGLAIMLQQRGPMPTMTHPVVLTWAYFTAFYALLAVEDRYHIPSHPFIVLLAAIAVQAAFATDSMRHAWTTLHRLVSTRIASRAPR